MKELTQAETKIAEKAIRAGMREGKPADRVIEEAVRAVAKAEGKKGEVATCNR